MEDHRAQLQAYIQQQLGQGIPAAAVRQQLIDTGWDSQLIDQVLHADSPTAPTSQPATGPVAASNYPTATHGNAAAYPQHPQTPHDHTATTQYDQPTGGAAPQKYKVFQAIGDSIKAAGRNPAGILVGIGLYIVISVASILLVGILVLGTLFGGASLSAGNESPVSMVATFLGIYLVAIFASLFVGSLLTTILAISFYDGAEQRKTPVGQLLSTAFKRLLRVMGASLLSGLAIMGPIIAVSIISGVMALGARDSGESSVALIGIVGGLAAFVWAVLATFRFALAPYVAIFEPETPVTKTLSRSKHLLLQGGQWFLLKALLLSIVLYIIIGMVGGGLSAIGDNGSGSLNILSGILYAAFGALCIGTLALLYRNRRLVRG